ncbi:hypothetical protein PIB30_098031 [Stylosanthes scabra]|uniref:Uncharacterized protein n=1 Tax=Stylosanthes scabra TaxID=79078 RepID=A0ABU6XY27_9FABA|nr:hypothetical protein [Stylosanthes scabra]
MLKSLFPGGTATAKLNQPTKQVTSLSLSHNTPPSTSFRSFLASLSNKQLNTLYNSIIIATHVSTQNLLTGQLSTLQSKSALHALPPKPLSLTLIPTITGYTPLLTPSN